VFPSDYSLLEGEKDTEMPSDHKEIVLQNLSIKFPFSPYECQEHFMSKVIAALQRREHALLESPTGTGKTLCLLCAVLAWRQAYMARRQLEKVRPTSADQDSADSLVKNLNIAVTNKPDSETWLEEPPKIYYASRTHSQLTQVVKELRNTQYHVRTCILGSREQMCLNKDVQSATSNTARSNLCRQKVSKRTCEYHTGLDRVKNDVVQNNKISDIEDLITYGEKMKACPYYLSRENHSRSDIVFLPYNYLIDSTSGNNQNIDLKNSVIIFDEAHNLESFCNEATSFEITSTDIAQSISEVDTCMKLSKELDYDGTYSVEEFTILKSVLLSLERKIDQTRSPSPQSSITKPGKFIYDIFKATKITFDNSEELLKILEEAIKLIILRMNY